MTFQIIDPSFGVNAYGGSSFTPGMPLLPSSAGLIGIEGLEFADPMRCLAGLGVFDYGLAGFDAVERNAPADDRTQDFKRVLIAATMPGTPTAGAIARALTTKAIRLADLAADRAEVTHNAREGFRKADANIARLDALAEQAAQRGDMAKALAYRKQAFAQGRLAIRYQKVNALATGMTQNAMAQSTFATKIAEAVLAGRPDIVAALGVAYDKLGAHTDSLRDIREQQVSKAQALQGLSGLDEVYERELDGLEALEGRFFRKLRKKVFKPIRRVVKKAAQKVGQVAAKLTVGLSCKLAQTKLVGGIVQAAGTAVGTFYGGPVGGAVGGRAAERAHDTTKTLCHAMDEIGITKGHFHKGRVKSALKEAAVHIAKKSLSPKEAFKTLTSVGTSYLGGAGGASGIIGKLTGGGGGGLISKIGGGGGLISKIGGGGGGGVLSTLVKGAGGKVDLLGTFAKGGGGDLLNFGSQTFAKMGLQNLQGQYLNRMKQVAAEQIAGHVQAAAKAQLQRQAGVLLKGALNQGRA